MDKRTVGRGVPVMPLCPKYPSVGVWELFPAVRAYPHARGGDMVYKPPSANLEIGHANALGVAPDDGALGNIPRGTG